jgi:uncharacterized protein YdiU (UPF0061 family)
VVISLAAAALGIPTSRALALIHLPQTEVLREKLETAAIVTRVAPSWVRIGVRLADLHATFIPPLIRRFLDLTQNFEIQRERREWDSLRQLTYYTARELFGWKGEGEKDLAKRVLREVAARNAKTIAAWQVWGFMHGLYS